LADAAQVRQTSGQRFFGAPFLTTTKGRPSGTGDVDTIIVAEVSPNSILDAAILRDINCRYIASWHKLSAPAGPFACFGKQTIRYQTNCRVGEIDGQRSFGAA
jgi:hypothetical protein